MVILWQDYYGKSHLRKSFFEVRLGKGFQVGMLIRPPRKGIILICVCGRHQVGWKETKPCSDVETIQQRSRFGRTNIFP